MKIEAGLPEVVSFFKEIHAQMEKAFEFIQLDDRDMVGKYLTSMMNAELILRAGELLLSINIPIAPAWFRQRHINIEAQQVRTPVEKCVRNCLLERFWSSKESK
jgi:hypothetical protein